MLMLLISQILKAAKEMATPNNEYWQSRFEQLHNAQIDKADDFFKRVDEMYRRAIADIEKDTARWYMRLAANNDISLREAKKLLKKDELEEFKWTLNQYIKRAKENGISADWSKQLENASAKYHISRLDALKLQVQQHLEYLYGNYLDGMYEAMRDTYQDSFYNTAYELQKGFKTGFEIARINEKTLEKILSKPWAADELNFSDRLWRDKTKLINTLQSELVQSLIRGTPQDKVVKSFADKMNVSLSQAGRLIATETAYFASLAEKDSMEKLGTKQYEILATLDRRTSDICRHLDGKVFNVSDFQAGITAPPFHCWCRSCTIPHIKKLSGSRRAARGDDGKTYYIDGNMKYNDWKQVFVDKSVTIDEWRKANNKQSDKKNDIIKVKVKELLYGATTKLQATMQGGDYQEYIDVVAKNKDISYLYINYADKVKDVIYAANGGTYSPRNNTLKYSFEKTSEMNRFSILAHEYGHFFDSNVAFKNLRFQEVEKFNEIIKTVLPNYTYLANKASYSDEFLNALRLDKQYIKSIFNIEVRNKLKNDNASSGVQDAIDGLFINSRIAWGHGESYYNRKYNDVKKLKLHNKLKEAYTSLGFAANNQSKVKALCRIYDAASEAWANIMSAVTTGGKELEYIKEFLPNSYNKFLEIIQEVNENDG